MVNSTAYGRSRAVPPTLPSHFDYIRHGLDCHLRICLILESGYNFVLERVSSRSCERDEIIAKSKVPKFVVLTNEEDVGARAIVSDRFDYLVHIEGIGYSADGSWAF